MTRLSSLSLILMAALATAAALPARASERGETVLLDLDTALRMALSANLAVKQGALLPQVGAERVREEGGRFDPLLEVSRFNSSDANMQPLDPFGSRPPASEVRSDDYEAAVRGLLPTGATYRAGVSSRNLRGTFNDFADDYFTFLGVSVTQPLLRNFGAGSALAELRLARREREGAGWQYRQIVNDTITWTALSFYDLVRAREALRVSERSVALVEQLVRDNELRHQRGATSAQDVVEARARAEQRKDGMFAARLALIQAENQLKRLIYADFQEFEDRRIEPRPTAGDTPGEETLRAAMDGALEARPDYQQARVSVERRRIELGAARSRALPGLDLVASYGLNGNHPSFSDSFSQAREGDAESYSVGAIVSVPLPNRSAGARKRIATLELRRAELALEDFGQEVRRQLSDAYAAILISRERTQASRLARTLAAQSLEAEEKRLRAGTSTTFLVLEQQENLAGAELREASAVAGLASANAEFFRLSGHTLEGFGIDAAIAGLAELP